MAGTNGTGGRLKRTKKEQLKKHYPWMEEFDYEAKVHMTVPEVRITHVLKLITMLERNVSPEVSKLKNKPNRATKFLKEIRKRISLTKIGGFLTEEPELETKLFPTYGLLMTHIVNIYLISSMLEKYAPQNIASELYYFLKLMFQDDNEYILDVVLCSNLDEHTSSKHKVGFQLFSFIVEDWRLYSDSHPLLMKYCAVCALLLDEASQDGRQVVENHVPAAVIDKSFVTYLRQTLDIDFGGAKKKLNCTVAVIQHIKPTTIKSFSRSRLVVVSTRDITGGNRGDGDSASSDSSSSTVNLPSKTGNVDLKEISSSSSRYLMEDPMNPILRELGLGGGFFLDTVGSDLEEQYEGNEYLEDLDEEGLGSVSSSTRRSEESSSLEKEEEEEEEIDEDPMEIDESPEPIIKRKKARNDSGMSHQSAKESQLTEHELNDASDDLNKSASNLPSLISSPSKDLKEVDSDLEVVSIVGAVGKGKNDGDSGCSTSSRDEEEAESGEDVVPNYDVDSDLEEGQSAAKNEDGAATVPEDKSESEDNVVDNIDVVDEDSNSILTVKLHSSPVEGSNVDINVKPAEKEPTERDNTEVVPATASSPLRTRTNTSSPTKSSPVVKQTLTVASPLPSHVKANPEEDNEKDNESDVSKSPKRAKIESGTSESKTESNQNANVDVSQEEPDKKINNQQTARRGGTGRVSVRLVRTIIERGNKSNSECETQSTASVGTPVVTLRRTTRATAAAASKKSVYDNDSNEENSEADENVEEEEKAESTTSSTPVKKTTTTTSPTRGRGRGRTPVATPATRSSRRK